MISCSKCGVEVIEQAGFCHKCGERLTSDEHAFPATEERPLEPPPAAEESLPSETSPQPSPSAADKLKDAIASRHAAPDDEEEEDPWKGGYSSKAMIGAWFASGLITIGLLAIGFLWVRDSTYWLVLIGLILLLWAFQTLRLAFRRMNIRYEMTTHRFTHETGILRRVTDRIEVIDMDDITFEQSFLERFVGVGTIRILSTDASHPELLMPGIEDGKRVADLIDTTRRNERRRRGLHIENI